MLTFAPPRRQGDGKGDEYSRLTAINTQDLPDLARQEFKQETDIAWILARHGVDALRGEKPMFGEIDDTIDYQAMIELQRDAIRAYKRLPQHVKDKYNSMPEVLIALYNGTLDMSEPQPEEPNAPKPDDPA